MNLKPGQVYLFSAILLVLTAIFSVGYLHPDEHFQILEFAGWKLHITPNEDLPWEFFFRMRPSIQPVIAVLTWKICGIAGITSPFTISFLLRLFSAALTYVAMRMIYRAYAGEVKDERIRKWFLLLSFLIWFAIFNGVRFSSETWSGGFFVIAFAHFLLRQQDQRGSDFFITGLLAGISFIFRYQSGFLLMGFFAWLVFIRRERLVNMILLCLGVAVPLLAGFLTDRWFYGEWTFTVWNYFEQNILLDKLSGFGLKPWWYFFESITVEAIPPFSIFVILGFITLAIYRRKDILTWTLLPFILIHFLIGHKELRFLFPITGFVPAVLAKGMETVRSAWREDYLSLKWVRALALFIGIVNGILLVIILFNPADNQASMYKKIYTSYPAPVTLYYCTEDPFHRALDINFYKRTTLSTQKVNSWNEIRLGPGGVALIATRNDTAVPRVSGKIKRIYSTFPEWIGKVNINHWVDRTCFWYIYEVK
jgi:GPI mannosyltransferase 3